FDPTDPDDKKCHVRGEKPLAARLAYARHFAIEHATDRMWRGLTAPVGQENPWSAGDVREMRVLGPIAWEGDPGTGLALPRAQEELEALPREGTKIARARGRRFELAGGVFQGNVENKVALLEAWIKVPAKTRGRLLVGSDDGCKIWLGRTRILEAPEP